MRQKASRRWEQNPQTLKLLAAFQEWLFDWQCTPACDDFELSKALLSRARWCKIQARSNARRPICNMSTARRNHFEGNLPIFQWQFSSRRTPVMPSHDYKSNELSTKRRTSRSALRTQRVTGAISILCHLAKRLLRTTELPGDISVHGGSLSSRAYATKTTAADSVAAFRRCQKTENTHSLLATTLD